MSFFQQQYELKGTMSHGYAMWQLPWFEVFIFLILLVVSVRFVIGVLEFMVDTFSINRRRG